MCVQPFLLVHACSARADKATTILHHALRLPPCFPSLRACAGYKAGRPHDLVREFASIRPHILTCVRAQPRPCEYAAMEDERRSSQTPSLLFTALSKGGSLQIFCPELDACENEVCLCARGVGRAWWCTPSSSRGMGWLGTTSRGDLPDVLPGPRASLSSWQACGDGIARAMNVLGLDGAMYCRQASRTMPCLLL